MNQTFEDWYKYAFAQGLWVSLTENYHKEDAQNFILKLFLKTKKPQKLNS